jgi:hypothetical protein
MWLLLYVGSTGGESLRNLKLAAVKLTSRDWDWCPQVDHTPATRNLNDKGVCQEDICTWLEY